jgi:CRP-like cAMP-binding protein
MASHPTDMLRSMDLFAGLGAADLALVARKLKPRDVAENRDIFAQGDPGGGLFVVLEGRVRIAAVDHARRERVLAFYGPGEFFGEMAVVTGEPRSATATAATRVRLLELRKEDFDVLVAENIAVTRGMLRVMVERQSAINLRLIHEAGTSHDVRGQVTVVFSPGGGTGKTFVATNLAVALAQLAPDGVLILDLDLLFGHVAMLLDLLPWSSLAAMTPATIRSFDVDGLSQYFVRHRGSYLRMLAGTLRPEDSETITAEHVRSLVDVLRRQFVHIVIDLGSRFSEPCLAALELADQVLVVTTPGPVASHAAQQCQRVLRDVLELPARRIRFVQNHPSPYGELSRSDLARSLATERVSEIAYGGKDVNQAEFSGSPVVMSHPANVASRAIVALADDLDRSASELVALSAR